MFQLVIDNAILKLYSITLKMPIKNVVVRIERAQPTPSALTHLASITSLLSIELFTSFIEDVNMLPFSAEFVI